MNNSVETQNRDQWSSKVGFILAAAGSAVGLGNLWKFPYTAGMNGGGAFVIVYFAILLLVGFTLMLAELVIGRSTQLNAVGAYRKINKSWGWVGGLGVLAGFVILSYYSVVGGWVINYIVKAATGAFNTTDMDVLGNMFGGLISSTWTPIVYHGIFMAITLAIVIGGISGGIEKFSKILMPALFIMIILIVFRSVTLPGAAEGVKFFLQPDFSKINGKVILAALGQVFFSLSLGMGCMVTYGSYLSKNENIPQSATLIPLLDTGVALLAGLAILPAVFALGFDPTGGPGLVFITLPAVFAKMPLGALFAIIFFLLVLFAAVTSSISLLEVVVAYVVDDWGWKRSKATTIVAAAIFLVGIPASLSMGPWSHITLFRGLGVFDALGFLTDQILLPLGGLMLCIFIGWVWGVDNAVKEATNNGKVKFAIAPIWGFIIKYIAPIAIGYIFISGLIG